MRANLALWPLHFTVTGDELGAVQDQVNLVRGGQQESLLVRMALLLAMLEPRGF